MNIKRFIVLKDGQVDHEASIEKLADQLMYLDNQQKLEASTIYDAIGDVFARYPGVRLPLAFIVSESLKTLNAQPENYRSLTRKVQAFIRNSPEFITIRGKGGGIIRMIDL
jgi:hypothetical protein